MEQGEPALVKSMTGYGRGEAVVHGRSITVELRSVNNRYLDCTIKLPRIYVFAEDAIKSKVQAHISRGKVDVFVTSARRRTGMYPSRSTSLLRMATMPRCARCGTATA